MEKLTFGLLVSLIGIAIVFFGLVILMCLIKGLVALTNGMGKEKKPKKAETDQTELPEPAEEPEIPETDSNATVAAIMAAVSCMMGDNTAFRVRHIRRVTR